jgi:hypothetical protein
MDLGNGGRPSARWRVAVKTCDSDDCGVCKDCGASGVSGIEKCKVEGRLDPDAEDEDGNKTTS